jgi:hypothetical protein
MKHLPVVTRRALVAALVVLVAYAPARATATSISKSQAQRTARRVASRCTEPFAISYGRGCGRRHALPTRQAEARGGRLPSFGATGDR